MRTLLAAIIFVLPLQAHCTNNSGLFKCESAYIYFGKDKTIANKFKEIGIETVFIDLHQIVYTTNDNISGKTSYKYTTKFGDIMFTNKKIEEIKNARIDAFGENVSIDFIGNNDYSLKAKDGTDLTCSLAQNSQQVIEHIKAEEDRIEREREIFNNAACQMVYIDEKKSTICTPL